MGALTRPQDRYAETLGNLEAASIAAIERGHGGVWNYPWRLWKAALMPQAGE